MNSIEQRAICYDVPRFGALALLLASAACSEVAGPARTPAIVAGPTACHVTAPSKVVAKRVFVPGGVSASEQDGRFTVRFATAASRCVSVTWPSESELPRPDACPADAQKAARTREEAATLLAWESDGEMEAHAKLGGVTDDTSRAWPGVAMEAPRGDAERDFRPSARDRESEAKAEDRAPIGHDRFLRAWVDGDVESHELRAQLIGAWGDRLGPSIVLSPPDASVIGRPSMVVAPTGDGLVTYVASIDGEFDVLATSVACEDH